LPVKPAQLVDVGSSLVIAGLLMLFHRYRTREGQVIALLMLLYPITRFILEMIRDDNPHNLMDLVLTHNQYTSIVLLVIGVAMWLGLRKLPASAGRTWAQRLADERIDSAGRKALKS
jgi:phosphatidylglycerol---prolipoprotein diacylglyceryl transferase